LGGNPSDSRNHVQCVKTFTPSSVHPEGESGLGGVLFLNFSEAVGRGFFRPRMKTSRKEVLEGWPGGIEKRNRSSVKSFKSHTFSH
jgi:hypothetical protein